MSTGRLLIYYQEKKSIISKIISILKLIVKRIFKRRFPNSKFISGVDRVFLNLLKSFDLLKVEYIVNPSFSKIKKNDKIIILGRGLNCLNGYNKENKIIAGIGLMSHPTQWLDLPAKYPIAKYLQHSDWCNEMYKNYYGDICSIWPSGIDTIFWKPEAKENRHYVDFLIYNKIHWNKEEIRKTLISPMISVLDGKKITYLEIQYNNYSQQEYLELLNNCSGMIFISEHESQGLAYQECMAVNVPIFAWENNKICDPDYLRLGEGKRKVTSVPYFDATCGMKFKDLKDFENSVDEFLNKSKKQFFQPRDYVLNNLSLEKSGELMLQIINEVYETN